MKKAMHPRWIASGACTLLTLLLSACVVGTDTVPYPLGWAALQHEQKVGSCPRIEGTYYNEGEFVAKKSGRPCADKCRSLISALVSDEGFITTGAERDRRPYAEQVQIRQPTPESIEISTKPSEFYVSLTRANGDFICDREGVRLRERTSYLITLIANLFSHESRLFNVADDGALVMKSEWHNWGNRAFVIANFRDEGWVRWNRVPAGAPDSK